MKKISTIMVILIVIIGLWLIVSSIKRNNSSLSLVKNNPTIDDNSKVGTTMQLFDNSPLSKNAFLISIPTYDANTKNALIGFNVNQKLLADGSNEITLNSQNPEYQTQIYTVRPGEKLYFIESFAADDKIDTDKNLKDDTAILVDANGYIVKQ